MLALDTVLERDGSKLTFLLIVVGNGTDLPVVSINAASSSEESSLSNAVVVYRRTGSSAIFRGNFRVVSGQWTASGPTIVTNNDQVFVSVTISFTSSDTSENCSGTFTGNISYYFDADDDDTPYTATEGDATYTIE